MPVLGPVHLGFSSSSVPIVSLSSAVPFRDSVTPPLGDSVTSPWRQCHPPLGTASSSPPLPKVWSCEHVDAHGHRAEERGEDGFQGMKGLFGKSADPALNAMGLWTGLTAWCNTALARQVWTSEVSQPLLQLLSPFFLTRGFPPWALGQFFWVGVLRLNCSPERGI